MRVPRRPRSKCGYSRKRTRQRYRTTHLSPPRFRLGYAIHPSLLPVRDSPYPGGEGGQKVSNRKWRRNVSLIDFSSDNSREEGREEDHFHPNTVFGDRSYKEVGEVTVSTASEVNRIGRSLSRCLISRVDKGESRSKHC